MSVCVQISSSHPVHHLLHTKHFLRVCWSGIRTRYRLIASQLLYQMSYPLVTMSRIELDSIPQNHRLTLISLAAAYLGSINVGEAPD